MKIVAVDEKTEIAKDIEIHDLRLTDARKVLDHLKKESSPKVKEMKKVFDYLERELLLKKMAFRLAESVENQN